MKNKKELHNDKYILDACCGLECFGLTKVIRTQFLWIIEH